MSAKAVMSLCTDELTPAKVRIAPGLLDKIAYLVLDGYAATSHGGLEIGGLLFGRRDRDFIMVEEFRPLPCDHSLGPRFILSSNDERKLRDLINCPAHDATLQGFDVLGWYCSHTRSELLLLDRELVLHDTYFAGPDDFVLIFKPRDLRSVTAGIFLRGADAMLPRCPSTILEIPEAGAAGHANGAPTIDESDLPVHGSRPVPPTACERLSAFRRLSSAVVGDASDQPTCELAAVAQNESITSDKQRLRPAKWKIVLAIAGVAVLTCFGAWRYRQITSIGSNEIFLSLHPQAGKLILTWKSNLVRPQRAGIDILDGTFRDHINITEIFQPSGVFLFPHNTGNVQAVLSVETGNGVVVRKVAFMDPSAVAKAATPLGNSSGNTAVPSLLPPQAGNQQLTSGVAVHKHAPRRLRRRRHQK
jgi:hypothetical protein